MATSDSKGIVKELFAVTPSCYGHCKEPSRFEFIGNDSMAVQVCSDRYVSRIVVYGDRVDADRFKRILRGLAPGMEGVENGDIRVASRYAWDLGLVRPNDDLIVRLAYWTQSYRRTKDNSPDRVALFLCSNRDSFFMQTVNSGQRLCQSCRR